MKRLLYLIIIFSLAFSVYSCDKDYGSDNETDVYQTDEQTDKDDSDVDPDEPDVDATAVLFSLNTTNDITNNTDLAAEPIDYKWQEGDEVGVFVNGIDTPISDANLKLTSGLNTNEGLFTSNDVKWSPEASHDFTVYFPYKENMTNNTLTGTISSSPICLGTENIEAIRNNLYFYGNLNSQTETTDGKISIPMKTDLAVVEIIVDLTDEQMASLAGKEIENLEISTGDGEFIAGDYSKDLSSDEAPSITNGTNMIKMKVADDSGEKLYFPEEGPLKIYAVINPTEITNLNIYMVVSWNPYTMKVPVNTTLQAGMKYTINYKPYGDWIWMSSNEADRIDAFAWGPDYYRDAALISSSVGRDPSQLKGTNDAISLPLVDGEYANCYIINTSSELTNYKIKAVKPDGTETGGLACTEGDGYVYFTAVGKAGNALVADFNEDGTVAWSWHIWITDTPQDLEVSNWDGDSNISYNSGSFEMMDRNLGATSASREDGMKTHGLRYQWGRPTPFVSSNATGFGYAYNDFKKGFNSIEYNQIEQEKSMEYAVSHPTTFISNANGYTWFNTDDEVKAKSLWGNPDANPYGFPSATTKNVMNDPCPYGYKVAPGDFMRNVSKGGVTNADETLDLINYDSSSPFEGASADQNGFMFAINNNGGSMTYSYFPAVGSIHGADVVEESSYTIGSYWTSSPGWGIYSATHFTFSSDKVNTVMTSAYANAEHVRCVKVVE